MRSRADARAQFRPDASQVLTAAPAIGMPPSLACSDAVGLAQSSRREPAGESRSLATPAFGARIEPKLPL